MNQVLRKSALAIPLMALLIGFSVLGFYCTDAQAAGGGPAAPPACPAGLPCSTNLTPLQTPLNTVIGPEITGGNPPQGPNDAPNAPNAGKASESMACDADFMNQIYGKAFLEAEREVVSANAIMLKPDSVMEYTCFSRQSTDQTGAIASFSGPTGALSGQISGMVTAALGNYYSSNFAHSYLGGADTATVDGNPCTTMYDVFMVAKCSEFGTEAPFRTFAEFIGYDPRRLPQQCSATHQITQALIDLANNANWAFSSIDKVDDPAKDPDNSTIMQRIWNPTGTACDYETPLPTGVRVYYREYGQDGSGNPTTINSYEYDDKFCTNPGCYFENNANTDPTDDECLPQPP